jgi:serine/threonine-protein kinase
MGAVYLAEDTQLDRLVALKLPRLDAADREERCRREARAAATLSHRHICPVFDAGQIDDVLYIAMAYIEGETLAETLHRGQLFTIPAAVTLIRQLALAMHEAHQKGVIHRDLKPANVMIDVHGEPIIMDFGLARRDPRTGDARLTQSGTMMGTLSYMSPEQINGDIAAMGPACDIYSLGVILYELLVGRVPFTGAFGELVAQVVTEPPAPPSRFRSDLDPALEAVCLTALAKKPGDRFSSMQKFAEALDKPGREQLPHRLHQGDSSLAVLPLENASRDPELEYLSDGITESIINLLSRVPGLRVMARSTVFRYKGRPSDAREVGQALGVQAILTGRLVLRANRLVIGAELVDVADGSQLWGEQFNRELADVFAVEEAIAKEIAEKLQLRLSKSQKNNLSKRQTRSTEAYQLYLKGRHHGTRRTEAGLNKSMEFFEQAITRDPGYALAWAGLADAFHLRGLWALVPPRSVCPRARSAAVKALELDETLAEAHASLAAILKDYDWDFIGGERELRRALELNPNYSLAHLSYGECLAVMGRHAEAIAALEQAQQLDPLSLIINASLARFGYFYAGQCDRAVEQFRKTLDIDTDFWIAHLWLGYVHARTGKLDEAITSFITARRLDDNPETLAGLGHAHARAGQVKKARECLSELEAVAKLRYVSPILSAVIHAALGEKDQAFVYLEKSYEDRIQWLSEIRFDPLFEPLRSDSRYSELLGRIGLSSS